MKKNKEEILEYLHKREISFILSILGDNIDIVEYLETMEKLREEIRTREE